LSAFWSLSVEMQYYLLAPFVFYFLNKFLSKKFNIFLVVIGCFLFSLAIEQLEIISDSTLFFTIFFHLPYFILGFSTNYLISSPRKKLISKEEFNQKSLSLVVVFVALFVLLVTIFFSNRQYSLRFAGLVTCALIIALERFAEQAKPYSQSINLYSILQSLGVLSYGFYLWHSAIGYIYCCNIALKFNSVEAYLKEFGTLFLITIIFSLWSFCFIEKPFLNKKVV